MDEHFCPMCGVAHGGADGAGEGAGDEVAVAAIESMAEVSTAAIDGLVEMHAQEEETEQVEALTEMVSDVTEIEADALGDEDLTETQTTEEWDETGDEGLDPDQPETLPEPDLDHQETEHPDHPEENREREETRTPERSHAPEESPSEREDEHLEAGQGAHEESTPIGVPPQLADDEPERRPASRTTNSFRRRRVHRR